MKNIDYLKYDSNGRIIAYGVMPEYAIPHQMEPTIIGKGLPETHYVLNEEVLPRPVQESFLEGMTLKNLPIPCTIKVDEEEFICTESTATLAFGVGKYTVEVQAFPYLPYKTEITV